MIKVTLATEADIEEALANKKRVYDGEFDIAAGTRHVAKNGYLYCLRDDAGNIGCLGGFTFVWSGVATVSALTTSFLDKHPVGYVRTLRRIIEHGMERLKVHRCEIYVKNDYQEGHRFAKALGFTEEGIARAYGPDKSDYMVYGRVKL